MNWLIRWRRWWHKTFKWDTGILPGDRVSVNGEEYMVTRIHSETKLTIDKGAKKPWWKKLLGGN